MLDLKVMSIIFDLMDITVTESEAKPGSRKGRPNHDPEFRRRLAAAACEPGVSVAKLARENGINANMLFTWRSRYRAQLQAESTSLIPVSVVHERPPARVAMPPEASGVSHPTPRTGTIEIRIGGVVVKVDGVVDAETLRAVLGSLRS
ncbi:IS66-like element accessory protein TnpA [Burkholderia humptydooensis]|nr:MULTISPECIES: transposase [Burkholderia]